MVLYLKWIGKSNRVYILGKLFKEQDEFVFTIDEKELKEAISDGCFGIGSFDLLQSEYRDKELFDFFKKRIISRENPNIDEFLKSHNLEEYDEMEILKVTKAELGTDRYFVEE